MLLVLGKIVGDGEPRRLGANEDMRPRADGGIIDEGSHGDMGEGTIADDRIEQRAAQVAVRVVGIRFANGHEVVLAFGDAQSVAPDAGEWLEGRTGRPPAV